MSPLAVAMMLSAANVPDDPATTVRAFVDAYNARDYAGLDARLDDNAVWYSVDGGKISTDVTGRSALVDWTRNYLGQSCTSCKSRLIDVSASGRFVSTVERATWTAKTGAERTQASIAVYEVVDGRIRAVWYFPATP